MSSVSSELTHKPQALKKIILKRQMKIKLTVANKLRDHWAGHKKA